MKVGEENCLEGCVCWVLVVYGVFKECGERVYSVCDVMLYRRSMFSKCDVGFCAVVVEMYDVTMD